MRNNYLKDLTVWVLLLMLSLLSQPMLASADDWSTVGNQQAVTPNGDVYTVTTAQELAWIAQQVNSNSNNFKDKTIKLVPENGASIDLSAYEWVPIGSDGHSFYGTFDGEGYSIKGLWIEVEGVDDEISVGLFGETKNATIKDLHVELDGRGIRVSGTNTISAGAIAGTMSGSKLLNCYVTAAKGGSIVITSEYYIYAGGLVGDAYKISNSYATISLYGCTVYDGYNLNYNNIGGICGSLSNSGVLENCYATGLLSDLGSTGTRYLGGICGNVESNATVSKCLALNEQILTEGTMKGRIVGHSLGTLTANYASTRIPGEWGYKESRDGSDAKLDSYWSNLNASDSWDAFDHTNTDLLPQLKEFKNEQPVLGAERYLTDQPIVIFEQSEIGGVLIVKDGDKSLKSGATVEKGTQLTFSCIPLPGFKLDRYTVNKISLGYKSTYVVTGGDVTIAAEFVQASSSGITAGEVISGDGEIGYPIERPTVVAPTGYLEGIYLGSNIQLDISETIDEANRAIINEAVADNGSFAGTLLQEISLVDVDKNNNNKTPIRVKSGLAIALYLPYPATTDESYDFCIFHLNWEGEVETFSTELGNLFKTANGLKINVGSFSPFAVAWKKKSAPTPPPYIPTYYNVTLHPAEGAICKPKAGTYVVEEYYNFSFILTLEEGYQNSKPVVKANNIVIVPRESDGKYILRNVNKDTDIVLEGIVKDNPTANAKVDGVVKVKTAGSNLYVYLPKDEIIMIYNTSGFLCKEVKLSAGETLIPLSHGIYIIKIANKTFKAAI